MSRIYDAIRTARESRSLSSGSDSDALGQMELPERRISPRASMLTDLAVYGLAEGDGVFYERAKAISGNANGGVLLLAIPVSEGQQLVLFNNSNSREQICNVIGVRIRDIQTCEVSVSFAESNCDFWSLTPAAQSA
jgi:hypothetical protein